MMQLEKILNTPGTVVIDVRTSPEYAGGHVANSLNLPLQELPHRIDELRQYSGTIVLCCASGNRSGQAEYFLRNNGFENVVNGGSWLDVNYLTSLQSQH